MTAENLAVSGPTPFGRLYEIATTYSETIELGGKRALREKAADATVSAAEAQFEDTMRRGLAEVKRLYLDALARTLQPSRLRPRTAKRSTNFFNSTRRAFRKAQSRKWI